MRLLALQILAAASLAGCAHAVHDAPGVSAAPPQHGARIEVPRWTTHLGEHHPLVGKIYDPRLGQMVTLDEVERRLRAAAIVTIGEKHDNPDHHRLEAALLEASTRGRRGALVVEMVTTDRQPALDAFDKTAPPAGADALGVALDWEHSGWPPFAEYRPLFAVAVEERLPIFAGDLPRAAAHDVAHRGLAAVDSALPTLSSRFALDAPLPPLVQSRLEQEVADAHCGMLPAPMLPAMALAQRVRDASLAGAVLDAQATAKAEVTVLVSGNGHARDDRAVPALLEKAGVPRRAVLSVAILEVEDSWPHPADYGEELHVGDRRLPFDLVWFTPRANEDDPCKGMTMPRK